MKSSRSPGDSEAMRNAVEVAIRAYDPCLSCAPCPRHRGRSTLTGSRVNAADSVTAANEMIATTIAPTFSPREEWDRGGDGEGPSEA